MLKQFLPFMIALFVFSSATAQKNNSAVSFYKAGIELKNKNKFSEATASFNKATALNKQFDSAYIQLGEINMKIGDFDKAINNFKKAIAINPEMPMANIALGNIYRDAKPNYDSALLCYFTALKKDDKNKITYYSIAWCYNAKGEYENAITNAIKALYIDNTYKAAYSELGHAYHKAKKYSEAIAQFKKNLSVSIVDMPIFYSGLCYIELKDKEGAMQQYVELKKINEKLAESLKRSIDKMQ